VAAPIDLHAPSLHSWAIEQSVGSKRESTLSEVVTETHRVQQLQRESLEIDLAETPVVLETFLWVAVKSKIGPHVLIESACECLHDPLTRQRIEHQ
jgi:hypothetical protein